MSSGRPSSSSPPSPSPSLPLSPNSKRFHHEKDNSDTPKKLSAVGSEKPQNQKFQDNNADQSGNNGEEKEFKCSSSPHSSNHTSLSVSLSPYDLMKYHSKSLFDSSFSHLGSPGSTDHDRIIASQNNIKLTFGEVSWEGVEKMMRTDRLNAENSSFFLDLGCGCGRMVTQTFLQFPNIIKAVGVEFSAARYYIAHEGVKKLSSVLQREFQKWKEENERENQNSPKKNRHLEEMKISCVEADNSITLTLYPPPSYSSSSSSSSLPVRVLKIQRGDLFAFPDSSSADIIICETDIHPSRMEEFANLMSDAKKGMRLLTYNPFQQFHREIVKGESSSSVSVSYPPSPSSSLGFPFDRIQGNRSIDDTYKSSWGHPRFHLFHKIK